MFAILFALPALGGGGCSFQSDSPAPVMDVTTPVASLYSRGGLKSSTYLVKQGDTLYSIAWASNQDFIQLAKNNSLKKPYTIYPGQRLHLTATKLDYNSKVFSAKPHLSEDTTKNNHSSIQTGNASSTANGSKSKKSLDQDHKSAYSVTSGQQTSKPVIHQEYVALPKKVSRWTWPVKGKLIGYFSANEQGNNGIKISGKRGEAVKAAADGRVVYAGDALRGYGNLVIVKHSDDYLSAYAHADKILVKERQVVNRGQTLVTMGSTDSDRVMLHFEIRYHGKSVNPLNYLPKQ